MVPADSDRIPRVPPYSGGIPGQPSLPVRGCHPLRRPFPETSRSLTDSLGYSYNPDMAVTMTVWALSLSIATTQDIDVFFLLLRVLRCFSSPGSPRMKCGPRPSAWGVAPFGHIRITPCLRVPGHFRSLPRPSSPAEAKASSVRPNFSFSRESFDS